MGWFFLGFLLYYLIILAEQALVAVSPHDLDHLRNLETGVAQRALSISRKIRSSLSALLLARLFLEIWLGVVAVNLLLGAEWMRSLMNDAGWSCIFVLLLVAGLLGAIFWGIKKFSYQRFITKKPTAWLIRLTPVIVFWKTFFYPFVRHEKPLPEKAVPVSEAAILEDRMAISGEKRELELLRSIVQFGDTTVKQVMQPRARAVAVDFRTDFPDLLKTVREAEFSRLPVYDEDLDNVTGILYVKDLLPHLDKGPGYEWQQLIRTDVLLAPESKRCSELLQEFKQQKLHMAIVIDEYGGSAGIVTMEDLLEEVIGDIRDEFDEEHDPGYKKLDDYVYLFDGQTLLVDVCRMAGLSSGTFDDARNTADTLAGLALELKGDIPAAGDEISWNGYLLTVTAANNRRIEQLKLTIPGRRS